MIKIGNMRVYTAKYGASAVTVYVRFEEFHLSGYVRGGQLISMHLYVKEAHVDRWWHADGQTWKQFLRSAWINHVVPARAARYAGIEL